MHLNRQHALRNRVLNAAMLILHLLGHERYDYATTTNIDDTDDRKNSDDGAANACRALQYRGQRRMVVPRLFLPLFCHDVICEEK